MATTYVPWYEYDPPDPDRNRKHKISEGATKADSDVAEETRKQKAMLDDLILSAKRVRVKHEADRANDPVHYEYLEKRNVCYAKRCVTPVHQDKEDLDEDMASRIFGDMAYRAKVEVAGRFEETGVRPHEITKPDSGNDTWRSGDEEE